MKKTVNNANESERNVNNRVGNTIDFFAELIFLYFPHRETVFEVMANLAIKMHNKKPQKAV